MKDLVEYIVKNIVTKPQVVTVEESSQQDNIELLLTVDPSDMGLVIGKNGQIIKSIRRLLAVRAIAEHVRVNLRLFEPVGSTPKEPAETPEI